MNEFGRPADYSSELIKIVNTIKKLRSLKDGKYTNWREAAEWHMKYSNLHKIPSLALTITLSPTGCEWAKQGGCTMCGEFEGAYKHEELLDNPQFHISQFVSALMKPVVWNKAIEENVPISWLRINQEGNFTNPNEMNKIAQENILRLATKIKGIKRVTIESRPQYLDENTIKFLYEIFKDTDVELEIGMGIEAKNDVVRNICVNKQGTDRQFIETAKLLRKYNIHPLAYIILKPPFLSESEAINEAVDTAHFVADIGYERISLEPMSIHQYTLVDLLKETGDYKAPWLWSVIEVAKKCADISSILGIGGVGYYPIPSEYSHNYCNAENDCNIRLIELIKEYNNSRDVSVFDNIDCSCKREWEKECNNTQESLKERINSQLNKIESIIDSYNPKELCQDLPVRNQRIIIGNSQK